MLRFDKDVKKRWLRLALVNMVVLFLVYGALVAGFGVFATEADVKLLKQSLREYGDSLNSYPADILERACEGASGIAAIDNPSFYIGVYKTRGDGSYAFSSNSTYLNGLQPGIGGRPGEVEKEKIGSHIFYTYTIRYSGASETYLKVFAPADAQDAASGYILRYSVPFIVAFLILGIAFSLVWGYLEIKPVMTGYYKQKSFINDMSHEIRTPLAIIKGNLENIIAAPDAKVAEVREMLDASLKEVDYMSDIASGLLSIVRGENRSMQKSARMSETVSEVMDMFSDVVSMSGRSLVACIDSCDIAVDRDKVKQLVTILLDNAIKYTREGDRISVRLRNTGDGCLLTVSDTGIGVASNELETIFDRFYRAENAREIPGTGLGLSIAKAIVESMNGTIKASQNIPDGLEITVQIKRT